MVTLAIDIVVIYFCSFKYIKKILNSIRKLFMYLCIYVNILSIFIVLRKPSNTINIIFNSQTFPKCLAVVICKKQFTKKIQVVLFSINKRINLNKYSTRRIFARHSLGASTQHRGGSVLFLNDEASNSKKNVAPATPAHELRAERIHVRLFARSLVP